MPAQPTLNARIFTPLQSIIDRLLPDFAERVLDDPEVRAQIIEAVDTTMISEYPAARALPPALRQRIIRAALDAVLGKAAAPRRRTAARAAARTTAPISLADLELTDHEKALLEHSAPGNSVHGFIMDAQAAADVEQVRAAVKQILGAGWVVERLDPSLDTYRAAKSDEVLSVPAAWTLSHKLEEHKTIARAEPEIEWVPAPATIGGPQPDVVTTLRRSAGGQTNLLCSEIKTWHLDIIKAKAAWEITKKANKPQNGKGVTIGHLDTGITHHDEVPLDNPRILLSKGRNMFDPNHPVVGKQPLDPMLDGFMMNPAHGTGTLSILTGRKSLTGTASDANIIPYRVSPSVVHFDVVRIAEGIKQAHADGCDVITMSMGGPPARTNYLEQIIERASEDGVIICTAAGNQIGSNNVTPMVVWPAAMDRVIAVAGCNCQDRVWTGSSRGPEVNITAAAQDVWRAEAMKGAFSASKPGGTLVKRGHGTSFATPTVAGIAACWLAHHGGRKALAAHYGHPRYVPLAFAHLLRTTAHRAPAGWDTKRMGPGILDAEALLKAPLPSKASLTGGWPRKDHPWFGNLAGGIFKGIVSRGAAPRTGPTTTTRRRAGAAAPASAAAKAQAELFEGELAYHLFDRPALIEMLQEAPEVPVPRRRTRALAMAAAVAEETRAEALDDATALLRATASEQLARALQIA